MSTRDSEIKPAARLLGALIGGVGTYFAAHWFNAWELSDPVILITSAAMAVAGFTFGPKAWDLVIHFV